MSSNAMGDGLPCFMALKKASSIFFCPLSWLKSFFLNFFPIFITYFSDPVGGQREALLKFNNLHFKRIFAFFAIASLVSIKNPTSAKLIANLFARIVWGKPNSLSSQKQRRLLSFAFSNITSSSRFFDIAPLVFQQILGIRTIELYYLPALFEGLLHGIIVIISPLPSKAPLSGVMTKL